MSLALSSSRSDAATVAVGFSPRLSIAQAPRRGATSEREMEFQSSLRDERFDGTLIRGLKPTATFKSSLRDGTATPRSPFNN